MGCADDDDDDEVILLELYQDARDRYWVRVLYNGKEMIVSAPPPAHVLEASLGIPQTADQERALTRRYEKVQLANTHEEEEAVALCPYDQWKELATTLIPTDYERECSESL